MIKIIDKKADDVVVCSLEGKLSGLEGKGRIQEKMREYIKDKNHYIVLDLSRVNWIDSTGLGELIAALSSVKKEGGNLILTNLQGPVKSLLKMTNLNEIFDIYDDVDEAVTKIKKK